MGIEADNATSGIFEADGALWMGMPLGMARYDGISWTYYQPPGEAINLITTTCQDLQGGIWMGGRGSGLFYWQPQDIADFSRAFALNQVLAVTAGGGDSLWIAVKDEGLLLLEGGRLHRDLQADVPGADQSFGGYRDTEGRMWFKNYLGALRFADGVWTHFDQICPTYSYLQLAGGDLLAGTPCGIWRFEGESWQPWVRLLTPGYGHFIYALAEGPEGRLWAQADRLRSFAYPDTFSTAYGAAHGLVDYRSLSLLRDADGSLWVGTPKGLVHYRGGEVFDFSVGDQGPGRVDVRSIQRDRDGLLWAGTMAGLWGYDGDTWTSLDTRDGLSGLNVDLDALAVAADGALWLSVQGKLMRYRRRLARPGVRLVEIKGFDGGQVEVGTRLSLEYRAIDLISLPEKRRYRHRLWRDDEPRPAYEAPSSTSVLEWTPEEAGRYTFKVQAIDRDLNYSEPAQWQVEVVLPWQRDPRIAGPLGVGVLLV